MRVKKSVLFILMAILGLSIIQLAMADPQGASEYEVTNGLQATRGTAGVAVDAQAGNVSRLDLNDSRITDFWQGYYGNVSGEISLDDSFNSTFYSWVFANPQGEIYASNTSSVTWANVHCVNFTANPEGNPNEFSSLNLSILETYYGMNSTDNDGFDETYTALYTGSFDVGSTSITAANECPLAYGYVNNQSQSSAFENVLLTTNESLLFTAIVGANTGYNGEDWDFELLVAENGKGNEDTSTYYFFVELQ